MATESTVVSIAQEGKYLSFVLGGQEYGLEILKVQEINAMMEITRVPRTPDYVRGVVNLRGRVIPVISLRKKFQMAQVEDTEKTCIIVVQVQCQEESMTMGVVVDEVSEVLTIGQESIEPSPSFGGGMEGTDYITGLGKMTDKMVILLDIDRVLDAEDMEIMVEATK